MDNPTQADAEQEIKNIEEIFGEAKPMALPVAAGFTTLHKPVTEQFLDRVRAALAGETKAVGYAIRENEWGSGAVKEIITVECGNRMTLTIDMTTAKGT